MRNLWSRSCKKKKNSGKNKDQMKRGKKYLNKNKNLESFQKKIGRKKKILRKKKRKNIWN